MISETHTGNHINFIQEFYPVRYNSNVLKMKRSWYLQRKINFNILINNQLAQYGEQIFLKCLGICFSQPLALSPIFQPRAPQFFSFYESLNLHSTSSSVASLESGHVILIRLLISSNEYAAFIKIILAGASLGDQLIEISALGGGDFILYGLIAFKICHMPSYGWAMITKIVHQLKLLQLSRFENQSPTMARAITIY